MRFRNVFLVIGSLLTVLVLILSDPDNLVVQNLPIGGGTVAFLVVLCSSVLFVGTLHLSRRALLDYVNLDEVIAKATQSPTGAGLVVVGIGLIMISIALVILAATK